MSRAVLALAAAGALGGAPAARAGVADPIGALDLVPAPYTISSDPTPEGAGPATVTVTRLDPALPETLRLSTGGGSATPGADYTPLSGEAVSFATGQTTATVPLPLVDDALDEPDEGVGLTLTSDAGDPLATGSATILDDDDPPGVSVGDATVGEGDAGTASLTFTVSLDRPSGRTVTVDYATKDGSATEGTDYTKGSGKVTFAPGETSKDVVVDVTGDTTDEPDETLGLDLSSPTNATLTDGTATGTIVDDDAAPTLSVDDPRVTEGNAGTTDMTFRVSLSAASGKTVTVTAATADGSATAGEDYTATTKALSFAPGARTQTVTVPITGDTTPERDETLRLELSGEANASLPNRSRTGTGTIVDDDPPPPPPPPASAPLTPAPGGGAPPVDDPRPSGPETVKLSDEWRSSTWAYVTRRVAARTDPSGAAKVVKKLSTLTSDYTPELVLALDLRREADGTEWVRVRLPMRPNNSTGWVPREALGALRRVDTALRIDRGHTRATLYRDGRRIWRARVGIGKRQWPTPPGRFYVRERLIPRDKNTIYGIFAFGTNGYSSVLTDWPGGGVIGVHGTNEPGLIPGRISHGCVRVRNRQIARLRRLMPLGTPVHIL